MDFNLPSMSPPPLQLTKEGGGENEGMDLETGGDGFVSTTTGDAPLQRQIGPDGDGKEVRSKDGAILIAKKKDDGTYDLFEKGNDTPFATGVSAEDPKFDLIDTTGNDNPEFNLTYEGRRVVTSMQGGKVGDSELFPKADESKDFSYSDLAQALNKVLAKYGLNEADLLAAIKAGGSLPIDAGPIELNPDLEMDMQLIAHHIMQYQNFHTPPNLKTPSRQPENAWRQEELDLTRDAMASDGGKGIQQVLPPMAEGKNSADKPSEMFSGALDISIPPGKEMLFEYTSNKAVYMLIKRLLWQAFDARQKGGELDPRQLETQAFLDTVKGQEGGVVEDAEDYLAKTMGIVATESKDSFDLVETEGEEAFMPELDLIYNAEESLEQAEHRRRTFLNTLGLLIKHTKHQMLDAQLQIDGVQTPRSKEGVDPSVEMAKHQRLLDALDALHAQLVAQVGETFTNVADMKKAVDAKTKMVAQLRNETDDRVATSVLDGFDHLLQNFAQQMAVGDILDKGEKPMAGIGPAGVKKEIATKKAEAAEEKKKKRREQKADRKSKRKRPKGS